MTTRDPILHSGRMIPKSFCPHLNKNDFRYRLFGVIYNYERCPIVYDIAVA